MGTVIVILIVVGLFSFLVGAPTGSAKGRRQSPKDVTPSKRRQSSPSAPIAERPTGQRGKCDDPSTRGKINASDTTPDFSRSSGQSDSSTTKKTKSGARHTATPTASGLSDPVTSARQPITEGAWVVFKLYPSAQPGQITVDHGDNTFTVTYDGGTSFHRVDGDRLLPAEERTTAPTTPDRGPPSKSTRNTTTKTATAGTGRQANARSALNPSGPNHRQPHARGKSEAPTRRGRSTAHPSASTTSEPEPLSAAAALRDALRAHNFDCLYYICHRNHLASVHTRGLLSHKAAAGSRLIRDDISNSEVQIRRERPEPCFGRSIHTYVPLYIRFKNPMLSALRDRLDQLCILKINLTVLSIGDIVFTDGNAASQATGFYSTAKDVHRIPWTTLNTRYWSECVDGKREACSEILVHSTVPPAHIERVACFSRSSLAIVDNLGFHSTLLRDPFS